MLIRNRSLVLAALAVGLVAALAGCSRAKQTTTPTLITLEGPRGSLGVFARDIQPEEDGPLKDLHFEHDRADIHERDFQLLRQNYDWLVANPAVSVEIEGHCDADGTSEYNLTLGARRAKAARDYLISLGIADARLFTMSYGAELPVCHEASPECLARNRRVHFSLLGVGPK